MATPFSPFVARPKRMAVKRRQSELPSDLIDWDAPEIPELEKQKIIYENHIKELQEDYDELHKEYEELQVSSEIEAILSEQVYQIAHTTVVNEYQSKLSDQENEARVMLRNIENETQIRLRNMENEYQAKFLQLESDHQSKLKQVEDEYQTKVSYIEGKHGSFVEGLESQCSTKVKILEDELTKERSRVNLLLGQIKMFDKNLEENAERADELERELEEKMQLITAIQQEKDNLVEERTNLQTEIENLNFKNDEAVCERNQHLEMYMQKKNEAEEYRKKFEALKSQLSYYKKLAKNKDINE